MLAIQKYQIKYNISKRYDYIKYIVIHDTGNKDSGANALMHYQYFDSQDHSASADFFVDDNNILQINDYHSNYAWHCGDGHGAYGITNSNSVGIEMCVNSDGDFQKTIENTLDLTAYLMQELNIPIERVIRHWDASRKICPQSFYDNGNWTGWINFRNRLQIKTNDFRFVVQKFVDKKIIGSPDYWVDNCVAGKQVVGQYVQTVILRFVAMYKIFNTFNECCDYLQTMGVVNSPDYWKANAVQGKFCDGLYVNKLLANMASHF